MSSDIYLTHKEAFRLLKKGNEIYQSNRDLQTEEEILTTPKKIPGYVLPQKYAYPPHIAILTCSDSRIEPKQLFWMPEGSLFQVQLPGNGFTPLIAESLFFAMDNFPIQLLLVLGHEMCGAVKKYVQGNLQNSPHLKESLAPSLPQYSQDTLPKAIKENVLFAMSQLIQKRPSLKQVIIGGYFEISSGKVDFFAPS